MNSRQDKEFLEKFFLFFFFWGGHFGPGPRQDKDSPLRDLVIRISW